MENSPIYLFLRSLDFFKTLDDGIINQMVYQSKVESFKKGMNIFESNDNITSVYFIMNGSVKLRSITSNDKVIIKEIVYEKEILGENIFSTSKMRRETAECIADTQVLRISSHYFTSLLEKRPHLCHELTKIFVEKLSNLETRMNNFIFRKAQSRIYDFLKKLAEVKGIKIGLDEILINHGLSHKEIAHVTDTSRQTVARVLGELKKDRIIHFSARKPHKILIRDLSSLSY